MSCLTSSAYPPTAFVTQALNRLELAVTDECPECKSGDLDLAQSGNGRYNVEWQAVQCDTGDTPVQYSFQGSNDYYLKLQIANTRYEKPLSCLSEFMAIW